jgi:hypothetical protein
MKDVQNAAEGANSAIQNIKFFCDTFFPHGSASGSKTVVTSSLVVRSSTNIYSPEHLPQFTSTIAVLHEPCKTRSKD